MRKKPDYLQTTPEVGQDFTDANLYPEYKLDESTGELVELDTKFDIQASIDSYADTAFERTLERFLPATQSGQMTGPTTPVYGICQMYDDDLDELSEVLAKAENYRERFKLSDDLSIVQVYEEVQKRSQLMKKNLERDSQRLKEKEFKKEVKPENEKTQNVETSQSQELQKNGK